MSGRLTRRELLAASALTLGGLALEGCGGSHRVVRDAAGSTLVSTWRDMTGSGTLSVGPGEPLLLRTDLAPAATPTTTLATFAHVTDAHVLDAASPARVPFLDRLGPPLQSTFRPQETLTAQVLAGIAAAVRGLAPDAVIQGGDLIDNAQANELARALAALGGGRVTFERYVGVQSPSNADPFYYRPDLDAPRHPGLLSRATAAFTSAGVGRRPVLPVLGDHDILVAGEIPPSALTKRLATGDEALWELPPDLTLPPGAHLTTTGSPDGPPDPGLVDQLLASALAGPKVRVPADLARRELSVGDAIRQLGGGASHSLDYVRDIGAHVRVVVLDLARRAGGSGGRVRPEQPGFLARALATAGQRHVVVVSHQPLASSEGGAELEALLDAHPRTAALLSGHTHRNRITPRRTPSGGYWTIETASLIDYPQQARALRLHATRDGIAITTWMLDHVAPGDLGTISRQLAYLDAQGGRPGHAAGTHSDRNATLFLRRR